MAYLGATSFRPSVNASLRKHDAFQCSAVAEPIRMRLHRRRDLISEAVCPLSGKRLSQEERFAMLKHVKSLREKRPSWEFPSWNRRHWLVNRISTLSVQ